MRRALLLYVWSIVDVVPRWCEFVLPLCSPEFFLKHEIHSNSFLNIYQKLKGKSVVSHIFMFSTILWKEAGVVRSVIYNEAEKEEGKVKNMIYLRPTPY
jgi:hypothetical protein